MEREKHGVGALGTALFCAVSQRGTREEKGGARGSHASSELIKAAPVLHINYTPRAC